MVAKVLTHVPLAVNSSMELLLVLATRTESAANTECHPSRASKVAIKTVLFVFGSPYVLSPGIA